MSKRPVTFTSGALIKILIDGETLAYAQGISFSVSKQIAAPTVLGEYGIPSLTSVLYNPVRGQMRIIKLAPKRVLDLRQEVSQTNAENRYDSVTEANVNTSTPHLQLSSDTQSSMIGTNENTRNSFDPAKVILSTTFDVEICQAYPSENPETGDVVYNTLTRVKNCRFDSRSMSVALGQLVQENVGFTGTLVQNFSENTPNGSDNDKIIESHN